MPGEILCVVSEEVSRGVHGVHEEFAGVAGEIIGISYVEIPWKIESLENRIPGSLLKNLCRKF